MELFIIWWGLLIVSKEEKSTAELVKLNPSVLIKFTAAEGQKQKLIDHLVTTSKMRLRKKLVPNFLQLVVLQFKVMQFSFTKFTPMRELKHCMKIPIFTKMHALKQANKR